MTTTTAFLAGFAFAVVTLMWITSPLWGAWLKRRGRRD